MKKTVFALLVGICLAAGIQAQSPEEKKANEEFSYAIGILIGNNLSSQGVSIENFNMEAFKKAFEATLSKQATTMDQNTANGIVQQRMQAMQQEAAKKSAEAGTKFLEENGKRKEVITTASGLQYEVLQEAKGAKPTLQDKVKVHYHGTLTDGKVFDSSVQRGQPISFPLSGVIQGWQEGVQLMTVGSKYRFFIPYNLAYGERGTGSIPGYATLIFDVELLGINED